MPVLIRASQNRKARPRLARSPRCGTPLHSPVVPSTCLPHAPRIGRHAADTNTSRPGATDTNCCCSNNHHHHHHKNNHPCDSDSGSTTAAVACLLPTPSSPRPDRTKTRCRSLQFPIPKPQQPSVSPKNTAPTEKTAPPLLLPAKHLPLRRPLHRACARVAACQHTPSSTSILPPGLHLMSAFLSYAHALRIITLIPTFRTRHRQPPPAASGFPQPPTNYAYCCTRHRVANLLHPPACCDSTWMPL